MIKQKTKMYSMNALVYKLEIIVTLIFKHLRYTQLF